MVVDPKGGVLSQVGYFLQRKKGYRIKVFNSIDFSKSMHYNPLAYIRNEADILKFVNALISNTKGEGKEGDPFWTKSETLLYCALIAYIIFEGPAEDRNMNTLVDMISGMEVKEDELTRGFISQMLRNPIYAQADLELYEFFKSQGTVVINEAADFAGTNGCYLYQGRDVQERKNKHLKDQILVVAPSEGLVSADVWLRCRKKLMANTTFQNGRKAKNTWLAGKVKCGRCGYALMSVGNPSGVQYLRCSKRADNKSCPGCGTLRTREFERFIYGEMVKKLAQFQTLTGKREKVNPKLTALNVELARVEDEIEKLLNTLTGASAVLISYANTKIEELDAQRQTLSKEIAALSAETMSPEQIERLSVYLNRWEEIDFDDRRQVADGLISQIRATGECVAIEWKI